MIHRSENAKKIGEEGTSREEGSSAAQTRMNPSAPLMASARMAGKAYDPPVSRMSRRKSRPLQSNSTECMSSTVGR